MKNISMNRVSVLGMGAMGSRMAASLLKAGYQVTVWNRTAERVQPVQALGATLAATPREAARGADVVISMLRDDVASRSAWLDADHGALTAMAAGSIAIESSTLTPAWVRELAQAAQGRGVEFLDAPVAGSRPQAEAGQLIYLVGGAAATLQRAEPLLKSMGGAVHHAGEVGSGATVKLMVNALFGMQVAAMAELLGWAQRAGLDASKALEIMCSTPVTSPAAKMAGQGMLAGNFAPMFPLELVEKDFGYALDSASDSGSVLPLAQSTHAVMQNAMTHGLAEHNLTALAKLYV
jgi:3-hydroxyisobutyrate dehydrogenase